MQKFKTVVDSKHRVFDLHLKETLKYRDLIFLFVKRDFVAKYKQTILGPLWAIIQPLLSTVVFTIIFGALAGLSTWDTEAARDLVIPTFLFYMSGTICWSYMSGTIHTTSSTFIDNAGIMGKVYYPRIVSPISTTISNLIQFGIQLAMFVVIWIGFLIAGNTDMHVTWWLLMVPLCILQMMILSMGIGIIISSLTTKYRDLRMLVGFGLQLVQYLAPIAYGLGYLQGSKWFTLYMLNPVTPIVTTFRYAMFGTGYFNIMFYLISWAVSLVVFFIGLIMFSKIERTFMDTV